jgi:hypothetical protein
VPYTDQIRGIPALLDAPHILRRKVGRRGDRQQAREYSSRNSCKIHIEFDTTEHD